MRKKLTDAYSKGEKGVGRLPKLSKRVNPAPVSHLSLDFFGDSNSTGVKPRIAIADKHATT